jgi:hypothetical protein
VTEGSTPRHFCVETSLPRTFNIMASSGEEALSWRESLGAAMSRYDTVTKAMAAKHAGDVCAYSSSRLLACYAHGAAFRFAHSFQKSI